MRVHKSKFLNSSSIFELSAPNLYHIDLYSIDSLAVPLVVGITMASAQNIIKCAVLSTSHKISYSIAQKSQNGPWIVLSNSFGADTTLYQPVAQRLASSGYRVLSYDHPGHGPSTPVKDVDNVEMEELINDIDELLRVLHIDSIRAWVGVSLGAASGIYLACRHPKLIQKLTYCACPPASFGALGIMPLEYFDKMRAQAEADGTTANVIRQMHYGWASKEWLDEHPDKDERLKLASSTLSLDGLRAMMTLQKNKRFDMRPLVPQLLESCEKIMFVKGDHDAHLNPLVDIMRDLVVKTAQERGVEGDFKVVTVPDSGHVMYLENEGYFVDTILEFIS